MPEAPHPVLDRAARRQVVGLALLIVAYVALVPGVLRPVITLTGTVEKADIAELGKDMIASDEEINRIIRGVAVGLIDTLDAHGTVVVYRQERSILGTVEALWRDGNWLVSFLVLLFSVVVPVVKGILILVASLGASLRWRGYAMATANAIGKWSMADVFVIAVIIALLAANASEGAGGLVAFDARFGDGFYYFLAYCVLSIASAQLMPVGVPRDGRATAAPT